MKARVNELTTKVTSSSKEEQSKITKLQRERDLLKRELEDAEKIIAKGRKDNQELTREAIDIHQHTINLEVDWVKKEGECTNLNRLLLLTATGGD